jgi:hypothetical protein
MHVGRGFLAAVVSTGLPRAGKSEGVPLKVVDFVRSVGRLTWAKSNRCPWSVLTCARIAAGGRLEVLRWARERHCSWDEQTCAKAAFGGHLVVLKWARENNCPWGRRTRELAQYMGNLEVVRWAQEHGAP